MKNPFGRIFNTTHAIAGGMKNLLRRNYEKSLQTCIELWQTRATVRGDLLRRDVVGSGYKYSARYSSQHEH